MKLSDIKTWQELCDLIDDLWFRGGYELQYILQFEGLNLGFTRDNRNRIDSVSIPVNPRLDAMLAQYPILKH